MPKKKSKKNQKKRSQQAFVVGREEEAARKRNAEAAKRREFKDMPELEPPTSEDELDLSSEDELDLSSEDKLKQNRVYEIDWKKLKIDWKKLKEVGDAKDAETCKELKHLFHLSMELGVLPSLKKREKRMKYLNTKGDPSRTVAYIWGLADSNKLDWVKGSGDPTPYETYKAKMNQALANVLCP